MQRLVIAIAAFGMTAGISSAAFAQSSASATAAIHESINTIGASRNSVPSDPGAVGPGGNIYSDSVTSYSAGAANSLSTLGPVAGPANVAPTPGANSLSGFQNPGVGVHGGPGAY